MQIVVLSISVLEGGIDNNLFNACTLLVVQHTKVVSKASNFSEDIVRSCETISDGNTTESLEESSLVPLFEDLGSNGWHVLAGIAFSKNQQVRIGSDTECREASIGVDVQLMQSIVEIITDLCINV